MLYGVQYYPEHWPKARWAVDARMMREAGINVVRMGEFAWSVIEPQEGKLDFSLMDEAVALLDAHGIKTIMCTPSRTPPPWAFDRYPGVRNVDENGRLVNYGFRYTVGLSHSEFIQLSQRIDRAVIEHFAGNDAIIGWQVDNEIGMNNDCYCERCRRRFHHYLEEKYGTLDALHEAWGSHFWSFTFTTWDEVPLPSYSPQLALEYRRFLSSLNVDFTRWRSELIHALDPGKFVAANFQSFSVRHTDYKQLAKVIDLNGMNDYPARSPELILDFYRGERGTFLPLEQFTRLLEIDTGPGWMRLWAYMAIAHGACGVNFFRWRCCRWGAEQLRDGILPHDGQPARRYDELARMGAEIARIGERIDRTRPRADVAVLMSYESRWAIDAGTLGNREWDPAEDVIAVHNVLRDQNVPTDALDPRDDLSAYRLVFAPRLYSMDRRIGENLRAFVENGGTLCLTAPSGVVDEFNVNFDTPRPGPLADAAGIRVSDLSPLHEPVPLHSAAIPGLDGGDASVLADEIHPVTATVLATYAGGWREGLPAITANRFGKGQVVYVGASLRGDSLIALITHLRGEAGAAGLCETPDGLHVYQRVGAGERLWFALNYTDEPLAFTLPGTWEDILHGDTCAGEVQVAPLDLRILAQEGA
ncbi:MAG TPA: beta-galactosidase [Aggregatilinea sp.]|uniref:beta-galactosidase n=1 Tax=Aggregatilinea sp. TaxID=2806333 RepID=UPI002C3AA467|nr:beta-galactosidase [Aggregatilinea sp.]HML20896.1 beta-galactosidase [Aggregatilinea sp.]